MLFNVVFGLRQVYSAKFGLLIGAPPSQQECCPWQGVTAPDGQATSTWVVMSFACPPAYFLKKLLMK